MAFRELLGYPPFRSLVQVMISAGDAGKCRGIADKVAEELKASILRHGARPSFQVLGPAAAPIEKLRGQYRFQVLLKGAAAADRSAILHEAFARLGQRRVPLKSIHVDVDPLSLL